MANNSRDMLKKDVNLECDMFCYVARRPIAMYGINAIQNQNLLITAHVLCINLVDCYLQL